MEFNFPCVFGYFSLNQSSPIFQPSKGVESLYEEGKNAGFYKIGASDEIHSCQDKHKKILMFGRIYSPIQINPFVSNDREILLNLVNADFNKIQGNFVFVIRSFEGETPISSIITDKYGFRRILYYLNEKTFYFSTHLLGLEILLKNKLPHISTEALLHYYNFGFTPNDQTILEGIHKVPPGHTLTIKSGKISVDPYFSVSELYHPEKYGTVSEEGICREIEDLLLKSVQKRILRDSPVGVALSGGVDSGYIAQKIVQCGVRTIGYNLSYNRYYDELDRVNFLAKSLGMELRKINVTPSQIINNFEYANSISSEPMGFNNATMRIVASKAKNDGVQLLFDGDGADRIFLGMNRYLLFKKTIMVYNFFKKLKLLPQIKLILRRIPGNELKKLYIHFQNWSSGIFPYPERDLGRLREYVLEYEWKIYNLAVKRHRDRFKKELGDVDFGLYFTFQAIQMCPELFFYDAAEIQTELGLFPASAFWDDNLISVAISVPTKMKLKQGKTKYILRRAAARSLDPKYCMLPKIGLQSSFAYISQSKEGQTWLNEQRKKVYDLTEYQALLEILPENAMNLDKLIGLVIWKELHNIK